MNIMKVTRLPQSILAGALLTLAGLAQASGYPPNLAASQHRLTCSFPQLWRQVAQWCPIQTIKKCRLFPNQ